MWLYSLVGKLNGTGDVTVDVSETDIFSFPHNRCVGVLKQTFYEYDIFQFQFFSSCLNKIIIRIAKILLIVCVNIFIGFRHSLKCVQRIDFHLEVVFRVKIFDEIRHKQGIIAFVGSVIWPSDNLSKKSRTKERGFYGFLYALDQ